jgi:hypothetical protein
MSTKNKKAYTEHGKIRQAQAAARVRPAITASDNAATEQEDQSNEQKT